MHRVSLLSGLLLTLALCACSTGSSNDSPKTANDQTDTASATQNTPNTTQNQPGTTTNTTSLSKSEAVTMANLIGSWSETTTVNNESDTRKDETITTFNADNTYTAITTQYHSDKADPSKKWVTGSAEKGTFSLAGDSLTWKRTHAFSKASGPVDITKPVAWEEHASTVTGTVTIIDGYLCNAYKRAGTGSGITGTWINYESEKNGKDPDSYTKNVILVTTTEVSISEYEDETGAFTATPDTETYTYTLDTSNVLKVTNAKGTSTVTILLAADWLCLGHYATKK